MANYNTANRDPAGASNDQLRAALDKLRLARTEGVGPVTYRRLLARFITAEAAIEALPEIAHAGGHETSPKIPTRNEAARELEKLHKLGGRMVFTNDPDYPPLLPDPPPCLAILGDLAALHGRAVGIVAVQANIIGLLSPSPTDLDDLISR